MAIKEQKVSDISKEFESLLSKLETESKKGTRIDLVELQIFQGLLKIGLILLSHYINLVSKCLQKEKGIPIDSVGEKMRNTGEKTRKYRSIFGELPIRRPKYYSKTDKVHYELDATLGLPNQRYSYLLTDWMSYGATEMSFDESVKLLERILNQKLKSTQSSRRTYDLSESVEKFYENKDWDLEDDGTHLSIGGDGKGVPIINKEKSCSEKSTAARLGKGKRGGIKKEATVTVSSSFTPISRDPEEIINGLFNKVKKGEKQTASRDNKLHQNKHVRAFVGNKRKALEYGIQNLINRDSSGKKPIIALMDGEPALRKQILEIIEEKGLSNRLDCCILDFIHVLEKVWNVANAYKGEKAKDRQDWVEQQARLLLNSQTQQVIDNWKEIQQEKEYAKTQEKHIEDGIRYFEKRIEMMDYKTFLQKGYPITTGAIESACGHFVKNRMERNGMRWNLQGAQKMLDIRAVNRNGNWEEYIKFFIDKEQQRIYKTLNSAA